ncbi:MAG TPA: signaling protein, partial [Chitinophagaceae bacterium]|nr:signaling protein [Chitinophagaceae bacterium]
MKKIVFACLAITKMLSGFQAIGQEEFIEPPSRLLTRISFGQLTGGIILFQAKLDNFPDTLNFILDTGSSGISLDST